MRDRAFLLVVLAHAALALCAGCRQEKPVITAEVAAARDVNANIEMLKDGQSPVRILATLRLGRMGAAARPALPLLKKMATTDRDMKVRRAAAEAVRQIEGQAP
jgi:HEAT repeat protein